MPRIQPLLLPLRPLALPRRVPCEQLFRFSTTRAAEAATHANKPSAPAPTPVLPSQRPASSAPKASRPADALDAALVSTSGAPTTFNAPSKVTKPARSSPSAARKTALELPPPKYHVARSSSRNLPIYSDYKRGGNLHLTTVRKITGDLSALRDELRDFLNKKNEDVKINSLTQHVIVKGHHVPQITEFLKARGM